MLKKFFLNLLSSFMGAWIALVLFVVTAVIVVIALIAGSAGTQTMESVTSKSVLYLNLEGPVEEWETPLEPSVEDLVYGLPRKSRSLSKIVNGILEGADNKNIKALYIECNGAECDPATLKAIRDAVVKFKESKKPVIAYSSSYSQGDYYIATAADSVLLNAEGAVALTGMASQVLYMKNLLDKVGVKMEVFKVGTYKSAVEPFILNEMSAPARAQLDSLLGNMWSVISTEIAESRKLKTTNIDSLINRDIVMARDANYAKEAGLVDRVIYQRNVDEILAKIVDVDKDALNMVSPETLAAQTSVGSEYNSKNQVAVIFASGEINELTNSGINCFTLVPVITELADNDKVKAVVLRVNSPGGSVFGSAQIADALNYVKSKGKPFIVSMGGYAASGGYWISCEADRIYADALTVTGSIGIFGMLPNADELAGKLGINIQTVTTNPNGVPPTPLTSITDAQRAAMQQMIEKGYDRFVARVAKGRNLPEATVRNIAEGRVWDGVTAKKLKLVDELGSLDDAIAYAARKAGIDGKEAVAYYPEITPSIWDMFSDLSSSSTTETSLAANPEIRNMIMVYKLLKRNNVQAMMIPVKFVL